MSSPVRVGVRALFLAMVALATLVPALASAQKPNECTIKAPPPPGKGEVRCQETLCGPAGDLDYKWGGPGLPAGGSTQCVTVAVSGVYVLQVTDRVTGQRSICTVAVTIDQCKNSPPDCSGARAKDAVLWPPNHEMVPVVIEGVTDPDGDPILITVHGVTQDEPLNVEGDGNTCADAEIIKGSASVRRERTGDPNIPGNGRVYTIYFTASDGKDGRCKGAVTVCVPHDMGLGDTCIDDGQFFDSTGPCPESTGP